MTANRYDPPELAEKILEYRARSRAFRAICTPRRREPPWATYLARCGTPPLQSMKKRHPTKRRPKRVR